MTDLIATLQAGNAPTELRCLLLAEFTPPDLNALIRLIKAAEVLDLDYAITRHYVERAEMVTISPFAQPEPHTVFEHQWTFRLLEDPVDLD